MQSLRTCLFLALGLAALSTACERPSVPSPFDPSPTPEGGLRSDAGEAPPSPEPPSDAGAPDGGQAPDDDEGSEPPEVPAVDGGQPGALACAPVPQGAVFDVSAYGALGDGQTDDRKAIRAAVEAAVSAGGGIVHFPAQPDGAKRVYRVGIRQEGGAGLAVVGPDPFNPQPVNLTLRFAPNARLKVLPNGHNGYALIYLRAVSKVSVVGGVLIGDKYSHDYSDLSGTHDHGHGVVVDRATDIALEGVTATRFPGDGVYVDTHPEERPGAGKGADAIRVCRSVLHDNSRTALALITVNGFVLEDSVLSESAKVPNAPDHIRNEWQAGIDIEPNAPGAGKPIQVAKNIDIRRTEIRDHAGAGLMVWGQYGKVKDVRVEDCTFRGNGRGFIGSGGYPIRSSQIEVNNAPAQADFVPGAGVVDLVLERNKVRLGGGQAPWGVLFRGRTSGAIRQNDLSSAGTSGALTVQGAEGPVEVCGNAGTGNPPCP